MGVVRVQSVLQGRSMKPEDVFVNTWHFLVDVISETSKLNCMAQVRDFFLLANTGTPGGAAVGASISNFVTRAADAHTLKGYDLGTPKPRVPTILKFSLPASESSTATELPAEIAVCASFYAGLNRPRYRGRVYIGPFTSAVLVDDTAASERSAPSAALIDRIAGALKRLITQDAADIQFGVYSTIDQQCRPASNGWVDDAWDIQRRRGQDASRRVLVP